jgi:hypothetical protein
MYLGIEAERVLTDSLDLWPLMLRTMVLLLGWSFWWVSEVEGGGIRDVERRVRGARIL